MMLDHPPFDSTLYSELPSLEAIQEFSKVLLLSCQNQILHLLVPHCQVYGSKALSPIDLFCEIPLDLRSSD